MKNEQADSSEDRLRKARAESRKDRGNSAPAENGLELEDFYAYMPAHRYIFAPTRELWPSTSVNARIPPVEVGAEDPIPASVWLDRHQPVEQLTWYPGEPMLIADRLIAEGGFIARAGSTIFNLYRPPRCLAGIPELADPWLDHVRKVYPDDAGHIFRWLAHRVQRPSEKINHALLLGGAPGIGKDTLLHPVSYAVGSWNFTEVTPVQLLGRFNGFIKSVILRINEARDLGEINRYAFYEHCKPITASPPEVLRVDEKNIREYSVPNVVGVIITSNYLTDGCYLPQDDRRHYVAWSPLSAGDLSPEYFERIYRWYDEGGNRHVAAWLAEVNLADFNPKAPPKKTAAFWEVVDAERGSEESEIADVIDEMSAAKARTGSKAGLVVFTMQELRSATTEPLTSWLSDPKNRRQIPKRLERAGYIRINNLNADDHLWKIGGKRQTIYGLKSVSEKTRQDAAEALADRPKA